jgi:hypothetical protein
MWVPPFGGWSLGAIRSANTVRVAGRGAVDSGQQLVNTLQLGTSGPSSLGGSVDVGPATVIEFRILGACEVVDDDHPVALGGPRVLRENPSLELMELAARVQPELVAQASARTARGLKRVGLATRSIQREHQLTGEPLPRRTLADECLELGHQLFVSTEGELGVDSIPEGRQPWLLQPSDLRLREGLEGELRERRPAPQAQRLAKEPRGADRIVLCECALTVGRQRLEVVRVDLLGFDLEQISVTAADHESIPELSAQTGDVALDDLARGGRRPFTPELINQAIWRDRLTSTQEQ